MRAKVTILINFKSEAKARSIHGSLKPDNMDLPKGLCIDMEAKGNTLTINFSSTARLETLISAMDDLLACCQASANTLTELVEAREKAS
ncbi:MAG: KEOPS complex subunit Pcc1 [Nitrososphaerales archaeon]